MSRHSPPIRIYTARRFTKAMETALLERYQVRVNESDEILSAAELAEAAKGCEYLFVSVTEKVTYEVITRLAPDLRLIATFSVGTDHIDLEAARAAGVRVIYTPQVLSVACAEIAMLLILNCSRRGHEANALVRSGQWKGWAPTQLLGLGLQGRRLGMLGMGRIGREIAARARSFGLSVHYHNRSQLPAAEAGDAVYHATADSLLQHSDVLCVCMHGGPESTRFLDARRIELLPQQAIVVNIARGQIIDDDALISALQSGRLFAAGLDVFAGEPALDSRYRLLNNVFLTSHIGSATVQTREAMGSLLLEGIRAFESGHPPSNYLC
jgi:lactate dehydrogenase-like 2-hydroxyacid dehydrogenase